MSDVRTFNLGTLAVTGAPVILHISCGNTLQYVSTILICFSRKLPLPQASWQTTVLQEIFVKSCVFKM